MKKIHTCIVLLSAALFLASCGSPEKKAQLLGEKYCDCLNNSVADSLSSMQIEKNMDSCLGLIREKYDKAVEKYSADDEKLKSFTLFFHTTADSTVARANEVLAGVIKKQLSALLWYKEGEEDYKNYLFQFKSDTMKLVNRKGDYVFRLDGRQISFPGHQAKGIIRFVNVKEFELAVSDSVTERAKYLEAALKDSMVGTYGAKGWDYSYNYYWDDYDYSRVSYSLTMKPNGDLIDGSSKYKYEVRNDSMVWKYHSNDKEYKNFGEWHFDGVNTLKLKGAAISTIYRYKTKEIESLDFMFRKSKEKEKSDK